MTEDWRDFWFDAYELRRERDLEQEDYERERRIERLYEKGELPFPKPKERNVKS